LQTHFSNTPRGIKRVILQNNVVANGKHFAGQNLRSRKTTTADLGQIMPACWCRSWAFFN